MTNLNRLPRKGDIVKPKPGVFAPFTITEVTKTFWANGTRWNQMGRGAGTDVMASSNLQVVKF